VELRMTDTPATTAPTAATLLRFLETYFLASRVVREVVRVREAVAAREAEAQRVQDGVARNNADLHRLMDQAGPGAAAAVTPHERLMLARLNTKIAFSLTRYLTAFRDERDAEAQKYLAEYDGAVSRAHFVWKALVDRVCNHVDTRALTAHLLLPGEIQTVVEEVDKTGKPLRLSRYGEMP
jgi:hypothetical protein